MGRRICRGIYEIVTEEKLLREEIVRRRGEDWKRATAVRLWEDRRRYKRLTLFVPP